MKFLTLLLAALATVVADPYLPRRILQLEDGKLLTAMESEKLTLMKQNIRFFDVTKVHNLPSFHKDAVPYVPLYKYPSKPNHKKLVNTIIASIDKKSMYDNLAKLTSFFTRYYRSPYGLDSANWLFNKISDITKDVSKNTLSIQKFDHEEWDQFSIIVRFKGSVSPDNIVVLGSHHDSTNLFFPSMMAAPGADDNGSGTITCLESLRLYVKEYISKGKLPKNTVEFHFYSAEEGGLLGSQDIFTDYSSLKKKVVAMLQQDMTGYVRDENNEHVGVITDYTKPELTDFIKLMINTYLSIPYVDTKCGYACSDHGSATKNGYPSAFVFESKFDMTNKYIHTTMDTLDRLSFDHMKEHVKLVLGTAVELGNWQSFE